MRIFALLQAVLLSGCCIWSPSLRYEESIHPNNIENTEIPPVSSGQCDGQQLVDSIGSVADGELIVIEGQPQGHLVCTLLGCDSDCCMNSCGYSDRCPYTITDVNGVGLCISHTDFVCGGSDCSPYCAPFSLRAENLYRFVGQLVWEGQNATLEVTEFCRYDEQMVELD